MSKRSARPIPGSHAATSATTWRSTPALLACTAALFIGGCASHAPKSAAQAAAAGAATNPSATVAAAPIPDDLRHAYDAALTSLQAGDWEGAAQALKPIVDARPDLPGPAVNLGIAYAHLNRADDARKIVDSAVQTSPGFAPAQHELGRLLATAGEFQAADAAYAHALADDANYALAYYDRAVLNELYLQRLPEALQNYEAYQRLQAKPDDQVARWIIDLRRRTGASAPAAAQPAAPAGSPPASTPVSPAPAATQGGSSS